MVLQVTARTAPAVPAWCHDHDTWECAAVTVDTDTRTAVGVCHTKVTPVRPWCAAHQVDGSPPP